MTIRNVVLVSYDSVRADAAYSGRYPGIERLRRRGTTFRHCVSSAPLTPVSHATVMTGLQPYHHGIRHLFAETLNPDVPTLASLLAESGYATSAVVSCPGLNRWYEICRGFSHYDDDIPRLPDGTDALQTVDVKLRGRALKRAAFVTARSREAVSMLPQTDFCFFIHFFDAHWPYEPPQRPFSYQVQNEYEAEIGYLDHHFNEWLDWMERAGRLDDTLVVLFGDHGEDLNGWYRHDKGGEGRGHPEEMGHGCLLHDQTITVPLIFSHPSFAPRDVHEQVRLVDVAPTILELLGQTSTHPMDGVSLASAVLGKGVPKELPAYSETFYPREQVKATGGQFEWTRDKKSVRIANRYKVVFHLESDVVEVYDLHEDPGEERDLLGASPACRGPGA